MVRHAAPYYCSPRDARRLLKHLDSSLGEPIPEKDYGGNCRIYDHESPEDPYHNLKDKMDIFIFAHAGGYWCKTLVRSSFPSNKYLKGLQCFKWLFLLADIPWLVAYHRDICYLRIYGIHFGTPATEFQRVLVGPLDSRRSDLQRWRHRSRPLHTQIPFHEDLQLAGTLQYTHLQRKNQTDICAIQVNTLHHQLMLASSQILGAGQIIQKSCVWHGVSGSQGSIG